MSQGRCVVYDILATAVPSAGTVLKIRFIVLSEERGKYILFEV